MTLPPNEPPADLYPPDGPPFMRRAAWHPIRGFVALGLTTLGICLYLASLGFLVDFWTIIVVLFFIAVMSLPAFSFRFSTLAVSLCFGAFVLYLIQWVLAMIAA